MNSPFLRIVRSLLVVTIFVSSLLLVAPSDTAQAQSFPQCHTFNYTAQFDHLPPDNLPGLSGHAYSIQFIQNFCFDGSSVWFTDNPYHRTFTATSNVRIDQCSNSGSPVNSKSSSYVRSYCNTNVTFTPSSPIPTRTVFVPRGAQNTTGNFELWNNQTATRSYSMIISPGGCVTISGIGRSGPVTCYYGP